MKHSKPLESLGLRDINAGVWSGSHGWSTDSSGPLIESINPATGQRLAQVRGATPADYEHVMSSALAADHSTNFFGQSSAARRNSRTASSLDPR